MEKKAKQPLIIGYDPGTTSAIAAINIEGEKIHLESSKKLNKQKITRTIIRFGKPVLLATDKAKTPSKAQKIANSLGIAIYTPEKDLDQEKKKKLGQGDNSHEVDAIASAQEALNRNKDQIKKVKNLSQQKNQPLHQLLKKYFQGKNIRNDKKSKPQTKKEKHIEQKDTESKDSSKSNTEDNKGVVDVERLERFERKVENLEDYVDKLEKENESLRKDKDRFRNKISYLKENDRKEVVREREINKREAKIRDKNREINRLEDKVQKLELERAKYKEAFKEIKEGAEILEKVDDFESSDSRSKMATRNRELAEKKENVFYIDRLEGINLSENFIMTGKQNKDKEEIKNLFQKYKEKRGSV